MPTDFIKQQIKLYEACVKQLAHSYGKESDKDSCGLGSRIANTRLSEILARKALEGFSGYTYCPRFKANNVRNTLFVTSYFQERLNAIALIA